MKIYITLSEAAELEGIQYKTLSKKMAGIQKRLISRLKSLIPVERNVFGLPWIPLQQRLRENIEN